MKIVSNKSRAFTLVEMSVTLLAMAVLVGGTLTARKVIERSKIQTIIVELDQIKKSIQSFSDIYNNLIIRIN